MNAKSMTHTETLAPPMRPTPRTAASRAPVDRRAGVEPVGIGLGVHEAEQVHGHEVRVPLLPRSRIDQQVRGARRRAAGSDGRTGSTRAGSSRAACCRASRRTMGTASTGRRGTSRVEVGTAVEGIRPRRSQRPSPRPRRGRRAPAASEAMRDARRDGTADERAVDAPSSDLRRGRPASRPKGMTTAGRRATRPGIDARSRGHLAAAGPPAAPRTGTRGGTGRSRRGSRAWRSAPAPDRRPAGRQDRRPGPPASRSSR